MTKSRAMLLLALLGACTPSSSATGSTKVGAHETQRWTTVVDRAGLEAALADAHGKPVLIDVTANWCTPCVQLRAETFVDRRVEAALADHRWIAIDVSDGTDAQLALQIFLGGATLPRVLRYDDSAGLLAAMRGGADQAPLADLDVKTYVDADELLAQLAKRRTKGQAQN